MERVPRVWARHLVPLVVLAALLVTAVTLGVVERARGDHDATPPRPPGRADPLPSVTTAPPTPAPAGCPESGLAVQPGGLEAAMGLRLLQLVVVNCGAAPRAVHGHPVVRVLDGDRKPLDVVVGLGSAGIATVAGFDAPPAAVTLQPGERAMAALIWRNTVTDASRPATNGRYLEVAVSGDAPAQLVQPDGGIDLGTTAKVGVAPWSTRR